MVIKLYREIFSLLTLFFLYKQWGFIVIKGMDRGWLAFSCLAVCFGDWLKAWTTRDSKVSKLQTSSHQNGNALKLANFNKPA